VGDWTGSEDQKSGPERIAKQFSWGEGRLTTPEKIEKEWTLGKIGDRPGYELGARPNGVSPF